MTRMKQVRAQKAKNAAKSKAKDQKMDTTTDMMKTG